MRILVAAERVGPAGGMERYIDVVLPELVSRGATVHVLARELTSAPGSAAAVPAGVTAERSDSFFPAFAVAADVSTGAEMHRSAGESGEFADSQTGLDGDEE